MKKNNSPRIWNSRLAMTVFIVAALAIRLTTGGTFEDGSPGGSAAGLQKDFAGLMTEGKLQTDLGNHPQAAEAFAAVAKDLAAPAALRDEAMVRLGLALSAAGDAGASMAIFKEAVSRFASDPDARRFLDYAVARTVPGRIWPDFRVALEELLVTAEVVSSEELAPGVTRSRRVYLKKGEFELKAVWRPSRPDGGEVVANDRAEIAAYKLDRILGLDMVPPTVQRMVDGNPGSIQLWINNCKTYAQLKVTDRKASDWKQEMSRMNLFDAFIGNRDRNVNNTLVDANWRIVLVDHSDCFLIETELRNPPALFDRRLVARLRALREDDLQARLKGSLGKEAILGLLKRRDALMAHLTKLTAERGEAAVLF
jgi:hypothetical protein